MSDPFSGYGGRGSSGGGLTHNPEEDELMSDILDVEDDPFNPQDDPFDDGNNPFDDGKDTRRLLDVTPERGNSRNDGRDRAMDPPMTPSRRLQGGSYLSSSPPQPAAQPTHDDDDDDDDDEDEEMGDDEPGPIIIGKAANRGNNKKVPAAPTISGLKRPKSPRLKPVDPFFLGNYVGRVTTAQHMSAYLSEMKDLLIANLIYWRDKNQERLDEIKGQEESARANWENNWVGKTDAQTGEIWDLDEKNRMLESVAKYQLHSKNIHDKINKSGIHAAYKEAVAAYEDFLYYQVEWNRRRYPGNVSQEAEKWLAHTIELFNKWHVGSRQNVPNKLGLEDIHRYPDNLRKTTKNVHRKKHLDKMYPSIQKSVNDGGVHLSIDQVPGIDKDAISTKRREINQVRRKSDKAVIPTRVYHAATEKSKPWVWYDETKTLKTRRTCFETNDRSNVKESGQWRNVPKKTDVKTKVRFEKDLEVIHPQATFLYQFHGDGARRLDKGPEMGLRWEVLIPEAPISYVRGEDFRLDNAGKRIESKTQEQAVTPQFTEGTVRKSRPHEAGRKERAEHEEYLDDFSDDEEMMDLIDLNYGNHREPWKGDDGDDDSADDDDETRGRKRKRDRAKDVFKSTSASASGAGRKVTKYIKNLRGNRKSMPGILERGQSTILTDDEDDESDGSSYLSEPEGSKFKKNQTSVSNSYSSRQWTNEAMNTIYTRFEETVDRYGLMGVLNVHFGRGLARELRELWEGSEGVWVNEHTQLEDQSEVLAKVFADDRCLPWCLRALDVQKRIRAGELVLLTEQRPIVRLERAR